MWNQIEKIVRDNKINFLSTPKLGHEYHNVATCQIRFDDQWYQML